MKLQVFNLRSHLSHPNHPFSLSRYRIDALTLFALPSTGPHGFHSLLRTLELSLRSLNNLLERLHASLFFYLYLRPGWATKVGSYLPAGILIGSGVTIRGLGRWRDARLFGCAKGEERGRSVVQAVGVMVACHAAMGGVYWLGTESGWFKDLVVRTSFLDVVVACASGCQRLLKLFHPSL
jgi:glycosylphosphatidylinositol transamidase